MRFISKNRILILGGVIIGFLVLVAILSKFISPYDVTEINIQESLTAPSLKHIFGTDMLGRDVLSRMIRATPIALSIGLIAVGISTLIGLILGAICGYYGGRIDSIIMRFADMMLCFPTLYLILAIVTIVGPNIFNIMIIIGLTSWMGIARFIRAEVLTLKEREYVLAAKALGANNIYIIFKHLIPNGIGPVLISFIFGVPDAILTEAGLSFLGLGVQPPDPSWGNILMDSMSALGVGWWLMLFPGLAIFITILGFYLLGEGLREKLNPKASVKL